MSGRKKLSLPINVNNEFGKLREVILSFSPANAVAIASNKVSELNIGKIDPLAFQREHAEFVQVLRDLGIKVCLSNAVKEFGAVPALSVFTRDPAFCLGQNIVVGMMFRDDRRPEASEIKSLVEEKSVVDLQNFANGNFYIEGGDVVMISPDTVAVGIGARTNEEGLEALMKAFPNYNFKAVEHDDLHLDVLFSNAGEGRFLADETRLPKSFLSWVESFGNKIVIGDPEEQDRMGFNVVVIDKNKVLAVAGNKVTNSRLSDAGLEVIELNMENLIKQGGGPRCLTLPTHRD